MIIKDTDRDCEVTDRGFEIIQLLKGSAGDADVELSALVAVAAMYFLDVVDVRITQHRVTILCERIAHLMNDFVEEINNGLRN